MFDESFFVAVSFFTVIGAFIYLKLPSKLMQALDEKSAEIARELDDAKALRAEAEKEAAAAEAKAREEAAALINVIRENPTCAPHAARVSHHLMVVDQRTGAKRWRQNSPGFAANGTASVRPGAVRDAEHAVKRHHGLQLLAGGLEERALALALELGLGGGCREDGTGGGHTV